MRGRWRHTVAFVGGCLLALGAPGPGAHSSPEIEVFEGDTDSYAASVSGKLLTAFPLPFQVYPSRTRAHIDSQPRAQGYAGIVDIPLVELLVSQPGPGGLQGPGGLPTYCYGNYPGAQDNICGFVPTIDLGEGVTVAAGFGRAHATGDAARPERTAASGAVVASRLTLPMTAIGASMSTSSVGIEVGTVASQTTVEIADLAIGDVLRIGAIVSTATTSAGGAAGTGKANASIVIVGATVAGTPIRITGEGVELTDQPVPGGEAEQLRQVLSALDAAGITVHPLPPPEELVSADGTSAEASVRGLRVTLAGPSSGDGLDLELGVARASSAARLPGPVVALPAVPEPPEVRPGELLGSAAPERDQLLGEVLAQPPLTAEPDALAPLPLSRDTRPLSREGGPLAERIRAAYIAGMFAVLFGAAAVGGLARRRIPTVRP